MRASRFLLASVLALAGCATPAQREDERLKAAAKQALAEMNACRTREAALPSYQALRDKLPPLDGSAPSLELETNRARPTPEEVPLLRAFLRDGILPCRKITLDKMAKVNPALVPPIVEAQAASSERYDRLMRREIAWSDFAMANYLITAALRAEAPERGCHDRRAGRALSKIREFQRRQAASTKTVQDRASP